MWTEPIFDRTLFDVQTKSAKGYINTVDLNRIENNIKHLADLIGCTVNTKNWADGQFIYFSDLRRMESNINNLIYAYGAYKNTPNLPPPPYTFYTQWNDIEKIIYDIYSLFNDNKEAVCFCGEIYAGGQIGVI
jgi:hypothetical protein